MTDNKQYPELPAHFMLVQESFRDEVYLYTADQMRAYADADRAMRAARDAEDALVAEDAARYRWLAAYCRSTAEHWNGRWSIIVEGPAPKSHNSEDDFDAAIDAAIDAARGAQGESHG